MKKVMVGSVATFSLTAQAHTLESLPDGLAHEILHIVPILIPAVLVAIAIKVYLSK